MHLELKHLSEELGKNELLVFNQKGMDYLAADSASFRSKPLYRVIVSGSPLKPEARRFAVQWGKRAIIIGWRWRKKIRAGWRKNTTDCTWHLIWTTSTTRFPACPTARRSVCKTDRAKEGGTMGYEVLERNLAAFDQIAAKLAVKLADDSPRGACGELPISPGSATASATFGLTHRTKPAGEVASALGAKGLFVWSGNFYAAGLIETLGLAPAGMVRIGFLHYNTTEEVDRALDALTTIAD